MSVHAFWKLKIHSVLSAIFFEGRAVWAMHKGHLQQFYIQQSPPYRPPKGHQMWYRKWELQVSLVHAQQHREIRPAWHYRHIFQRLLG